MCSSSCCQKFDTYVKNYHKKGFGIYSLAPEPQEATLLVYQSADEVGSETGAVRILFCPWCGASLRVSEPRP
jgi:hypothetical protein